MYKLKVQRPVPYQSRVEPLGTKPPVQLQVFGQETGHGLDTHITGDNETTE